MRRRAKTTITENECHIDDHLDYNTIMDLYRYNSEHIHFFVPLGK